LASYGQILKSSSITGGAAAIGLLIGMVSVKASAVLLGPAGVGQIRIYQSVGAVFATITGLGIAQSVVRSLAQALGIGDVRQAAALSTVLVRFAWCSGITGWAMIAMLAWPICDSIFDGAVAPIGMAVFGSTVLVNSLAAAALARLQAERRISTLAKVNIATSCLAAGAAVTCYWIWGRAGIVPALMAGAGIQLVAAAAATRASRSPEEMTPSQPWSETVRIGKDLGRPGIAFMAGSVLPHVTAAIIGAITVRTLGLDANGLYGAAWALSGLFASFVISAMGTDYFPRLSAVGHDPEESCRLVNEQIEAGLLLGIPGLVAMIVLAPVALDVFYAPQFIGAADLITCFASGVAIQLGSWPVGYLLLAQERTKLFVILQVTWLVAHVGCAWLLAHALGLAGLGIAFLAFNALTEVVNRVVVHRRTGFRWSSGALRTMVVAWSVTAFAAATTLLEPPIGSIAGMAAIALAAAISIRGLAGRLGSQHRVVRILVRAPVLRVFSRAAGVRATEGDHLRADD
jgi:antigen flippase